MNCVKIRDEKGNEFELSGERVLANDVVFSHERHPYRMRLWIIGNEFGALAAVWASCEQDAMDEACDAGLLDGLSLDAETVADWSIHYRGEGIMRLGNASEAFDATNAWLHEAPLELQHSEVQLAFAEPRGACSASLDII